MKMLFFVVTLGCFAIVPNLNLVTDNYHSVGKEIVIMPDPMITKWYFKDGKPSRIDVTLRGKNTSGKPVKVSTTLNLGVVADNEAKSLEEIADKQRELIKEKRNLRAARLVVKDGQQTGILAITKLGNKNFKSLKFRVGPRVVNTFIVN